MSAPRHRRCVRWWNTNLTHHTWRLVELIKSKGGMALWLARCSSCHRTKHVVG